MFTLRNKKTKAHDKCAKEAKLDTNCIRAYMPLTSMLTYPAGPEVNICPEFLPIPTLYVRATKDQLSLCTDSLLHSSLTSKSCVLANNLLGKGLKVEQCYQGKTPRCKTKFQARLFKQVMK